jgi:hypothetical protein
VAVRALGMCGCERQRQAAKRDSGATVLTSLDGELALEMACEPLRLTLVLAEVMLRGEGGGAVLATSRRVVRRRSEHGILASPHHQRAAWSG